MSSVLILEPVRSVRVLHCCGYFSPLSETFIYDYVTELERQGEDCQVMALRRVNEQERPYKNVHVVPNVAAWNCERIVRCAVALLLGRGRGAVDWPIWRRRMARMVRAIRPDVIHAHFGGSGVLVAPIAAQHSVPLVVTFYGKDISSMGAKPFWHQCYLDLWQQVAAITVLSEDMREKALTLGCPREKIHVVHLVRALIPMAAPRDRKRVRSFISVGRLVEKKGHADAIRAFARAARVHPGLTLDIIGDGPLKGELAALAKSAEMAGRIRLHGALPNRTVIEMMRDADAFVLCSAKASDGDEEGTPTALIEAQAIGLPCVSTIHAGIPEVIPQANHWLLCSEHDIEGIADRIATLAGLTATELARIGERGRQHVAVHFNRTGEVAALRRVYRAVVKGSECGRFVGDTG